MAYQKVGGTPRFYIDHYQYLKSLGFDIGKWYNDYYLNDLANNNYNSNPNYGGNGYDFTPLEHPQAFSLDPSRQFFFSRGNETNGKWFNFAMPFLNSHAKEGQKVYAMYLNHSLYDESLIEYNGVGSDRLGMYINFQRIDDDGEDIDQISAPNRVGYFNCDSSSPSLIYNNGCSIMLAEVVPEETYHFMRMGIRYNSQFENNTIGHWIGGISYGFYYDMPTSPDLDLSMSIEYDGFTNIKTLTGHTITQANYQRSPWWYDKDGNKVEPWSVGQSTGTSKRNGRRVWKLKFSYMSDKDLFASNYGGSSYSEDLSHTDTSDRDIPNLGANLVSDQDFDQDVSANTSPTGGREYGTGWATDSYSDTITGTSTVGGDDDYADIRIMSRADMDAVEAANPNVGRYTSSISFSYHNWRLYQNNVFKTYDNDLEDDENDINRNLRYTVSFRARYVSVENAEDKFQIGSGYYYFFNSPLTSTWKNYEVEFAFSDIPSEENDLHAAAYGTSDTAFQSTAGHRLTFGGYPSGNPYNTGWENHFQVQWVKVQQHNPSDFKYNIDTDDSFSAQVLNKISHGERFVFQPDNEANNPSDFAICVLDQNSIKMKRTSPRTYDIEMKIKEVW